MKKVKKISAFLLMLMLCVSAVSLPVSAASAVAQDGLEVSLVTDKEEYSAGEQIELTLSIKNTNKEAVTNLSLENFIADGYEVAEGYVDDLKKQIDTLEAGEETTLSVKVEQKDAGLGGSGDLGDSGSSDSDENNNKNSNQNDNSSDSSDITSVSSPKTGDNNIALWVVVCIAVLLGVGALLLIKNKKGNSLLSILLCVALAGSGFAGFSVTASAAEPVKKVITAEKTVKYDGEDVTFKAEVSYLFTVDDEQNDDTQNDDNQNDDNQNGDETADYKLVWEDSFDGTELNRADWNVELHDPGWVNAEWQEYVDSEENIYLEDGKLIIKPVKTVDENGEAHYTSGRINTQNKQTFTYGKFEARVKVPEGMGYLPAFWLMSNDENLYGQWPRCGEIDIMEVMGQTPDTVHGTIHYGNPHSQSQGTYVLEEGSFADDFHTFTVEWEPGKISWYVDGSLYHTESKWYSATEGQGEITYPAPFDQPFYIILNLAVGGSWVGYPDDTTDFENATYEVDYVKVYQKDSYDENVTKPEVEVVLRDPDANGNYIVNGDFAVDEDLADDQDWIFLLANGGDATAAISNNEMAIHSANAGTVDYSVQLVQPNLPMQKGATYKLTFDAYADAARTMIVDVSAPDRNYVRYLADTKVNLTTDKQTFTYEFTMTDNDDANGRLEFNLGNQGSTAGVKISNVKLEKTAFEEIKEDDTKTVLTDGNHVYNGGFQEGENRLGYWDITNNAGAEVSVTNVNNVRRLTIVAPEGTSAETPVIISQSGLALSDGSNYAFSFDTEGENGKNINVTVAGASRTVELTGEAQTFSDKFTATAGSVKDLVFTITEAGTFYLDNVRIVEDSLIKNGSFAAGFAGFEPFVDSSISSEVSYVVDSLNEDNAADFTINNTGNQDWLIQLKQENVELENGQWYRLTLDAKSSLARKLMVAIQRNGNIHDNDWTPYCQETVELGTDYQNYVFEFRMTEATDVQSVLSISMGAVGGTQITEQHRVVIDNINLEKIDAPKQEEIPAGVNLIQNPTFANAGENWEQSILAPGTVAFTDGAVTYDIKEVGVNDYDAQLRTFGIKLESGQNYKVSFKASSTEDRPISVNVMSKSYAWYGGTTANLTGEAQPFEFTFSMNEDNLDAGLFFSMGKMANADTPASAITISEISVVKLDGSSGDGANDGEDTGSGEGTEGDNSPVVTGTELIQNGNFVNGEESWVAGINSPAVASVDYSNNKATFTIDNVGTENWHLQFMQNNLPLESGETYKVTFKINSSADRDIKWALLDPDNSWHWYGGEALALTADTVKEVSYDMTADATSGTVQFQITMAPDFDSTNMPEGTHTIEISDVSVVKTSGSSDTETGEDSTIVANVTASVSDGDAQ